MKNLNKILESFKGSNMDKVRFRYKLKSYYNLNETQRIYLINNL
jgi:hypothetical protein